MAINNAKYFLRDGRTLNQYCKDSGLGVKEHSRVLWLIKNKLLSVDEAINYHRKKNPNYKFIRMVNQRRRNGVKKELLETPTDFLFNLGVYKASKYKYFGKTLFSYCNKNKLNYKAIILIHNKYNIPLDIVVADYKKGKTVSWYKHNYIRYD